MTNADAFDSLSLYRRLLGYVRPYWRAFALALVAMAIGALVEPAFPALLKQLLDGGFAEAKGRYDWIYYPLLLLLIFIVRAVLIFVSDYLLAWVANRIVLDMRQQMFQTLLRLPLSYYAEHLSSQTIARIGTHVTGVMTAATNVLTTLIRDSLTVVGLVGWLLYLNWRLTVLTFIIVPFIGFAMRGFSRRLRFLAKGQQNAINDMTQIVQEALAGQKIIKLHQGYDYEAKRYYKTINQVRSLAMRAKVAGSLQGPIIQFFSSLALASLMASALYQASQQHTTVGGFVSFLTAVGLIMAPIKRLTDVNAPLQAGLVAAENVFMFIDLAHEVDEGNLTLTLPSPTVIKTRAADKAPGDGPLIACCDICFRYPNASKEALNRVSFSIMAGECVGLVGPSGSGKSTLAALLPRFYRADSGEIRIDGIDINRYTLASLRSQIALVSQDVVLFHGSVADNIAYGHPGASRDDIRQAAANAHALEFIEQWPEGFDTAIGENGVKLSGGQRQRIAIARALLKDSPILILDEATSALDTASERHVQEALYTLMRGRTTLVIAHRLSTLEQTDRILVLDAGAIVESGSHQQLLAQGGLYAHLYRLQGHPSGEAGSS